MSNSRFKGKGRRDTKPFLKLPKDVLESEQYIKLGYTAKSLLIDIAHQFRGHNNGDLTTAWGYMHPKRGWKSKGTLFKAIKALEIAGFIFRTRQGGKNLPNLFAVTWLPIDECNGKHNESPQRVASNLWKKIFLLQKKG